MDDPETPTSSDPLPRSFMPEDGTDLSFDKPRTSRTSFPLLTKSDPLTISPELSELSLPTEAPMPALPQPDEHHPGVVPTEPPPPPPKKAKASDALRWFAWGASGLLIASIVAWVAVRLLGR